MSRSDMAQIKGATIPFRVAFGRRQSPSHQFDPKLGITGLGQQAPSKETRPLFANCKFVIDADGYRFISVG